MKKWIGSGALLVLLTGLTWNSVLERRDHPHYSIDGLSLDPQTQYKATQLRAMMPRHMSESTFTRVMQQNLAKGWKPTDRVVTERLRDSALVKTALRVDDDTYSYGDVTIWDWDDSNDGTLCDVVYIYDPTSDSDITFDVVLSGETLDSVVGLSDEIIDFATYGDPGQSRIDYHQRPLAASVQLARYLGSPMPDCDVWYAVSSEHDPYGDAYVTVLGSHIVSTIKAKVASATTNAAVSTGVGTYLTSGLKGLANLKNVAINFVTSFTVNLAQNISLPSASEVENSIRSTHNCEPGSRIVLHPY